MTVNSRLAWSLVYNLMQLHGKILGAGASKGQEKNKEVPACRDAHLFDSATDIVIYNFTTEA